MASHRLLLSCPPFYTRRTATFAAKVGSEMLSQFRNFIKSPWAVGLLVLMAIGLVVTGSQMDVFASLGPRHVIEAGDRSVDQAAFRRDFERARDQLSEQQGRPVTNEEMVEQGLLPRFLEGQTRRAAIMEWAHRVGIRPGQDLVIKQIRQVPAFFSEITGKFDQDRYQQALSQAGVTPEMLEREIREEYVQLHYGAALAAGGRTPRVYAALVAAQQLEQRDARWFRVTQDMAGRASAPTDAQLTAFLNENAEQLRRPELRTLSLVVFGSQPGEAPAVTEEQIQQRFEFQRETLSLPERRSFTVLTAPDRATADRIAQALRGGQSIQAVAAQNELEPAVYQETPRNAVTDPAVAGAVFGVPGAGVAAPVQARVGWAVAVVTDVVPAEPAQLEDVREAVVRDLQAEAERALIQGRVERFEAARASGRTLEQAVAAVGGRIVKLENVRQDGRNAAGAQINAPPIIFETAWELRAGGVSDVVDAGQGQYFVLRVDSVTPPALPPLSEVRDDLSEAWIQRENARRLSTMAQDLAGRVRGGQDLAAVAASVGAELVTRTGVQPNQEFAESLGAELLEGVFGQGKGDVFAQQVAPDAWAIGSVDAIRAPVPAVAASFASRVVPALSRQVSEGLGEMAIDSAMTRVKARFDEGLAREALGLPRQPAAAPTKAG